MLLQTSHCLVLVPIALSLFVAVRLSLGSMDDAKQSWMLLAVRAAMSIMLVLGLVAVGFRTHWLGLLWLLVLGVFGFIFFWKRRRLEREALLLSAMSAKDTFQQQSLASHFSQENFGWLRRKANALQRDLVNGRSWSLSLEVRGVATGAYERLAIRLKEFYGESKSDDLEAKHVLAPSRIESEAERLLGRFVLFLWALGLAPILYCIAVFILPTFKEMFEEFGLEMPKTTILVMDLADASSNSLLALFFALLPAAILCFLFIASIIWMFPVLLQWSWLRWLCGDYFSNVGFVALSRVVEEEDSMGTAFERCSQVIPIRHVAHRYREVGRRLSEGEQLESAVLKAGLVKSKEMDIFRASVNSIDFSRDPIWGFRQLAVWRVERMLSRYSLLVQIFVFALTIVLAVIVGLVAVGVIHALAWMILSLS